MDGIPRDNPGDLPFNFRSGPKHRVVVLAAYLVISTVVIYSLFSHWFYDDPFVTFRYADNLQRGLGFVYNPGERVLSTTTPFFTMLLALLGNAWSDYPHLANLVGALSLSLGAFFIWDLAQTCKSPTLGWSGLLLYLSFPLLFTTLGSEMLLYNACCLGAFALYARERYALTALFIMLAVLTRADGVLVAIILALDFLRARRPIPWRSVLPFIGLTLLWFAFAWVYFGSPIPATLGVKQQQGTMAISTQFAEGILTIAGWYSHWQYAAEAILGLFGIVCAILFLRRAILLPIWTLAYFLAYSLLGVSGYFWYYAPLVPGFLALAGLGIAGVEKLVERAGRFWADRGRLLEGTMRGVSLLVILVMSIFQLRDLDYARQHPDQRIGIYTAVGNWLRANTPPNALIGALEVGIIGYYAQRPMVDFAGLIRPEVAAQMSRNTTYEDAALWIVERYKPDYLVLHQGLFPRVERGYAAHECAPVQQFIGQDYNYSSNLYIYKCDNAKASP